ncbi:MAG: alpha-amylase family glycosyl hydrolase [Gemmatimonadota bacterium]|jgi:alpha-glucosidase
MAGTPWWEDAVLYQIYPRSYQDSDGDGVGDLEGIRSRLDYLEWLGVDAVWLSPVFRSPHADFGYDISDYRAVDPLFGTDHDLASLRDDLHARGLKLILDLVPNHSSEEHPWFRASSSSRDDPKRDWYMWADPAPDGGPPNNWLSVFGGSAWEWHEPTGQYYYHAFLKEQPDLNWRNPEVREAMLDVMRHWLEWGADGFRVDVMWHMIKDVQLRDNPPNPAYDPSTSRHSYDKLIAAYSTDQPEVHDVVAAMREVMDDFGERLLIGEIYLPVEQLVAYYGADGRGAHLPFNFQLVLLPWDREAVESAIGRYEGALPEGGWPNWVLGNHDKSRVAGRWGEDRARAAAVLLLTLRGTPTLYYGDELGIGNVEIPEDGVRDPQAIRDPGSPTRDAYRTPMQWTPGPRAGFSTAEPWLPLTPDHALRNVQVQRDDPASMLRLHRSLLRLRRDRPALRRGRYEPVPGQGPVLAYVRSHRDERILVAVNFDREPAPFAPPFEGRGTVLLSTHERGPDVDGAIRLAGSEAVVIELAR